MTAYRTRAPPRRAHLRFRPLGHRTPNRANQFGQPSGWLGRFLGQNREELLEPSPRDPVEQRKWLKTFAQWLYSSDHISIEYGIKYHC